MFALLLGLVALAGFRVWIEAPKYFMLRQERRFATGTPPGHNVWLIEITDWTQNSSRAIVGGWNEKCNEQETIRKESRSSKEQYNE